MEWGHYTSYNPFVTHSHQASQGSQHVDPFGKLTKLFEDLKSLVDLRLSTIKQQITSNTCPQLSCSPLQTPLPTTPNTAHTNPNISKASASFASVAASANSNSKDLGATPSQKPAANQENNRQAKGKPKLIHLVIQYGDALPKANCLLDISIYHALRPLIEAHSNAIGGQLKLVKWNLSGNLVLLFTHSSNATAILAIESKICNALQMEGSKSLHRATPWSKICIPNVATGVSGFNPTPFSKEFLLEEILYSNPALNKLVITQGPNWAVHPSKIKSNYASLLIAFEDKDGSIIDQLTKTKISIFGRSLKVRK
ncbi:hypothetical protein RSOLAG1IB_10228 [Rhizoctonia solani AG-1 IB]|uniref:Uncharacterized protein n=1 Tax=Thanatephorus cucumeris (strain AG1-IB / isolate 7/3/14) TaxID=1108050 RepID=M5C4E8_THACB|nr:hypothetical protein BN14_08386 [Rhizoctonia solani AG-1 IB]CEL62134.1 hypothetical protein RSOLAG1IB_10228 [Rhizoctonia solani AG-1 IB]